MDVKYKVDIILCILMEISYGKIQNPEYIRNKDGTLYIEKIENAH